MKLAVSGKGGVGKTTFSSLLIRTFNQSGKRVLAIDADPDANLAAGVGIEHADRIVPIAEMKELVLDRTGAQPGSIELASSSKMKGRDICWKRTSTKGPSDSSVMLEKS